MSVVLIDSSVWIDFLRQKSGRVEEIARYLHSGRAAFCPVTWLELSSGLRGKRETEALDDLRSLCVWLEIDAAVWKEANELARKATQSGLNCPMADVLIVACARRHGAVVFHRDKHIGSLQEL